MGVGSEDWFVAWGAPFVDFFARTDKAIPNLGFATLKVRNDPRFKIGGSFGGRFYGAVGYAGQLADNGNKLGPRFNSYSKSAGVIGTSMVFPGVAGTSVSNVGVYGQVEDQPQVPGGMLAGVLGVASTQPGVIGFARDGDGAQGLSFTGTAVRAASFFGPGVHSISGARSGVTGISNTQGPPVPMNIPTIAGVVGTSGERPGVIGTSDALMGVYGFSTGNAGVVGESVNSFAGYFAGNVVVTGDLFVAGAFNKKGCAVPFPDGTHRALYCMESPDLWFEDFGAAKLARGRATVKLDADFAKVIKRGDYHVFLTPRGDCRGLYVRSQGGASFEVRELAGGTSNVAFSYRIVGRRRDITRHRRFAKIDARLPMPAAATRPPRQRRPAAAALRAFIARAEKEAAERRPKGARKARKLRALPPGIMTPPPRA